MAQLIKQLLAQIIPHETDWKISLLKNWNIIIGDLSAHIFLEKIYQNEALVVGVYDSSWMQELYFLSPLLIKKINDFLGKNYIKTIRFKYIPVKKKIDSFNKSNNISKNVASVQLSVQEYKILDIIEDPHLKEAIKNFRLRCLRER